MTYIKEKISAAPKSPKYQHHHDHQHQNPSPATNITNKINKSMTDTNNKANKFRPDKMPFYVPQRYRNLYQGQASRFKIGFNNPNLIKFDSIEHGINRRL